MDVSAALAAMAGLSTSRLGALFREQLEVSPLAPTAYRNRALTGGSPSPGVSR
ncbi:hypothetical protein [Nonomuraea jabiensis]|uniref:hypothetical protein n=1 Tax=Nonomuraea jabiensis TaxID=882448 RepID=UPI0036A63415